MKPIRAWFEFWLPILSSLSQQTYHPVRDIRNHATTLFQKMLTLPSLSEYFGETTEAWLGCYEDVLFPLLDDLAKPELYSIDPNGMTETRIRVLGVMSKCFLYHLQVLEGMKEFTGLWRRILEYFRAFLGMQRREVMVSVSLGV